MADQDLNPLGLPPDAEGVFFSPTAVADRVAELAPEMADRVGVLLHRLAVHVSMYTHRAPSHAAALVLNQAVNDSQDLLLDLMEARGRSATRAARALVEHAVNFRSVLTDPAAADRYVRHGFVGAQAEVAARVGTDQLAGAERRSEEHRLRKLARDSRAGYDAALQLFGTAFRRSWAGRNLRHRADKEGLNGIYGYYQLASLVLHGAAGGAAGTVSDRYETMVHRTGPSLRLCVTAYRGGLDALEVLVGDMHGAGAVPDVTPLLEAVQDVSAYWPSYRRSVLAIDRHLWPTEAPPGPVAVLCVFRTGVQRWYWHEPRFGIMIEADPPPPGAVTPMQHANAQASIQARLQDWDDRDLCVSIAMLGVTVTPRRDRPAVPDSAMLVPMASGRVLQEPVVLRPE